jgi:hypothetical protein
MKKSTIKAAKNIYIPTIKEANQHLETENYTHLDEFIATFHTGSDRFRKELSNVLEETFLDGAKSEEHKSINLPDLCMIDPSATYLVKWKANVVSPYQVLKGVEVVECAQYLLGWTHIPESLSSL